MKVSWNANRTLSISAFLTSLVTVFALIYQSNLVRKQNQMVQKEQQLSVMPYLTMGFEKSNDNSFGLTLSNKGIGPAFINEVNIAYNDSVYKIPLLEFYFDVLKIENKNDVEFSYTDIRPKSIVPVGETIEIFSFLTSQEEAIQLLEPFATSEASIEIIYSSIYEQKWKMKNMMEVHIPMN